MKGIPRTQLILDYRLFFGEDPPEDRITLISHVSRKAILFEIAGLNYRLKPKDKIYVDTSLNTTMKELRYFTMNIESLYEKYSAVADKYSKSKDEFGIIFNRQACLFAMEEILSSQLGEPENFVMAKEEAWEGILKYLL